MKSPTPILRPLTTNVVWWPCIVDSRMTSRHHKKEIKAVVVKPKSRSEISFDRIILIIPIGILSVLKDTSKGQGLKSTKWNGWRIIIIYYYLDIFNI